MLTYFAWQATDIASGIPSALRGIIQIAQILTRPPPRLARTQPQHLQFSPVHVPPALRALRINPPHKPIGLTRKVDLALHLMVFGPDEAPHFPLGRDQAAEAVGLARHSLYLALRHPHVRARLRELEEVLRTSERPRAFGRIVELAHGAESEKVSLDASKFIASDGRSDAGVTVNVGIQVQPGYLVRLPDGFATIEPGGSQPAKLLQHDDKPLK